MKITYLCNSGEDVYLNKIVVLKYQNYTKETQALYTAVFCSLAYFLFIIPSLVTKHQGIKCKVKTKQRWLRSKLRIDYFVLNCRR